MAGEYLTVKNINPLIRTLDLYTLKPYRNCL